MSRASSFSKNKAARSSSPKGATDRARTPGPSPIPHKDPNEFPMRMNKYLAMNGFATRRGADELIAKKFVSINGRVAVLGDKVEEADVVEVHNSKRPDKYAYYVYNKARGITLDQAMSNVKSMPNFPDLFPLVSLDTGAEGLVILTNDRRTIDRMISPRYKHLKEYVIRSVQPLRPNFKEKIEAGVTIADAQPIQSTVLIRDEHLFSLRTTDNGNHVRQMCSMFFTEIESMKRTRIMNVDMGALASNGFRKIDGEELAEFLKGLGL